MAESTVSGWLAEAAWAFGGIGVVLAVAAGLWLVLSPGSALAAAARLNREFSVHWLQQLLDAPRSSEPLIYRHHRVFGALLVAATAFFFWQTLAGIGPDAIARLYRGAGPAALVEAAAWTLSAVLVAGNAIGFVLGLVIFFRPSLLKGAEGWANRWIASDRATALLDRRDDRAEGLAHRYPRRVGAVILLATTYIVVIALLVFK